MRRVVWMSLIAALAACSSDKTGPKADPFAVIWVRNTLSAGVGDSIGYKIIWDRVNEDQAAPGVISHSGDVARGEESCHSYGGIPQGTANPLDDSLAIQVWFVGYDAVVDTIKSAIFMPVTGPDPDHYAKWGVTLTDSGVVVQENPDSFPTCTF